MKFRLSNIILFLFVSLVFLNSCSLFRSDGIIDADDPRIQYGGRIDRTDPKNIRFDWPGVYFKTVFEGSSIALRLKDGNNTYNIFIDGRFSHVLTTNYTDSVYTVAKNLKDSRHVIKVTKRTEGYFGIAQFSGFILDPGSDLVRVNLSYKRKIEFIGDSYVAGFGNEGSSPECVFSKETENNYYAYGPVLARKFRAEYSVIAASGIGVLHNFGDTLLFSKKPMPALFNKTCLNDSLLWDFSEWQPDLVLVRLGRNDFAGKPFPLGKVFKNAYRKFILNIRHNYPNAHIFALCGPAKNDPHYIFINSVINNLKHTKKDNKLHFVQIKAKLIRPDDFGCQWHPNKLGHQKIANYLEPIIRKVKKW